MKKTALFFDFYTYKSIKCIIFLALALSHALTTSALTTATISGGAWGTAGNWNNGVPVGADVATVNT
ncbi:MAG TPA: hypothetical protein VK750_10490, partial [Cytophagaceae bacterium]|nr:hypothetical protein [Cytophagaceae bacterium]